MVEYNLKKVGINAIDDMEVFQQLKTSLHGLIGNRSRQAEFFRFFEELANQLRKKGSKKLEEIKERAKNEAEKEAFSKYREEIMRSREQLTAEGTLEAFSPQILTIIDRPIYEILKSLHEGEKDHESLRRSTNLKNQELIWRIDYLLKRGFVKPHRLNNDGIIIYKLSEVGKAIFEKRGAEFGRFLDLLIDDKIYQLSLKAVGEDEMMAEKFRTLLLNGRLRGHDKQVRKLVQRYAASLAQMFFNGRENGVKHQEHLDIKVVNYEAAGELIMLALILLRC